MHYLTLLEMAEATIAASPDAKRDSMDDRLLLSISEPKTHNGYRVRLFQTRGPYAVIINGKCGKLTVHASARRVREFLNGYVVKSELGQDTNQQ
jgi:hypothetical protein